MDQPVPEDGTFTSLGITMPIAEAVERACRGDLVGFAIVYEHYKTMFERRLFYLVGNQEVAYEIYQEAFLRIWRSLPKSLYISEFERWLTTIIRNLAFDYLRQEKRIQFIQWPESESDDPNEYALHGKLSEDSKEEDVCMRMCLAQALAQMSEQYRICLILHGLWGLPCQEIAQRLGVGERTVRSNLSRGREQLRKLYLRLMEDGSSVKEEGASNGASTL
jgi:RNA polymerase sigma-70 factor (ECF subfamily)